MSEHSEDQIHPATPTRMQQARRDGDFAKSFEFAAAVQMLGAIGVAYLLFAELGGWLRQAATEAWHPQSLLHTSSADVSQQLSGLLFSSLTVLAPICLLLVGVAVASHWCQTGPVLLTKKIVPDATRLAPNQWLGRLFSVSTLAFPLVGLPKVFVAMGAMTISCYVNRRDFFVLGNYPADQMISQLLSLVLRTCTHVAAVLLLVSLLDYAMKVVGHRKRLRMTEQQLRDEMRMEQGNRGGAGQSAASGVRALDAQAPIR